MSSPQFLGTDSTTSILNWLTWEIFPWSLNHANFGLVDVGNIPLIGLSKIGASSVNLSVVTIHHFELSSFLTKGHFVLLLRKLKLIFHRKP